MNFRPAARAVSDAAAYLRGSPCTAALLALGLAACSAETVPATGDRSADDAARCDNQGLTLNYDFRPEDRRRYAYLPFELPAGTRRLEVAYDWTPRSPLPDTPLTATTVDLGLWDSRGLDQGFRGWGGSRQGRLDRDTGPVFIEALVADRGFEPGPLRPGLWHVELGLAATDAQGAEVRVELRCLPTAQDEPRRPAGPLLDPERVARDAPGWYAGDFHMHGYHSQPNAPDWPGVIEQARAAGLDILALTDYVTTRHHGELAAAQAANPDLLLWPGREVITYFGHVNVLGEIDGVPEYRHGFGEITLHWIQAQARAQGALFQINHPTIFPPPLFSNLCRGCAFELDAFTDFDAVDTVEVVTGPPVVRGSDIGLPTPGEMENPFIATAIDWWLDKLRRGHRLTAVSASDSKGIDSPEERTRAGYGSSATRIYAEQLSRQAVMAGLRAGHAYIQVRGVNDSPQVHLSVQSASGDEGTFGDALAADEAMLRVEITGGNGQLLTLLRDATPQALIPVTSDPFVHEAQLFRVPFEEGPLGTIWRIEMRDARSRTIIGNPVFLTGPDS